MVVNEITGLDEAINAYKAALDNIDNIPLIRSTNSSQRGEDLQKVLSVLIARDKLAHLLSNAIVNPTEMINVVEQDQRLRNDAKKIVSVVGQSALAHWRDAKQTLKKPDEPISFPWWWSLDEQVAEPWFIYALKTCLWLCIAVALSFTVEIVRRFVSSGVDLPSTIAQGLLALLVGGTLIQFARQLVEGISRQGGKKLQLKWRTQLILAVVLVTVAVVLELSRAKVVAHYSNMGVDQLNAGQLAGAIQNFQRGISLKPNDAIAHFNLASAYESVLDYDKAEAEYRAAIQWNKQLSPAYSKLARLYILRRNDPGAALMLLRAGLRETDAQSLGEGPTDDNWKR
ncbi:MAG TPA: tetratricopeptide repeat protein, partial [Pyrinomonadaceae bacterium]